MPISSLVITLDAAATGDVLSALRSEGAITLGPRIGSRVPAVLETNTLQESSERVTALAAKPGVLLVDVVRIDFEDAELDHAS